MRGVVPMSVNVASAQIGPQSGSASVWCVTLGKGLHCHRPQFPYLPVSLGIVPPSSGYRVGIGGVMRSAGHSDTLAHSKTLVSDIYQDHYHFCSVP